MVFKLNKDDHAQMIRSGTIQRDLLFHLEAVRTLMGNPEGPVTARIRPEQAREWIIGNEKYRNKGGESEAEKTESPKLIVMLRMRLNPDDDFVEYTIENLEEIEPEEIEEAYLQVTWPKESRGGQ